MFLIVIMHVKKLMLLALLYELDSDMLGDNLKRNSWGWSF